MTVMMTSARLSLPQLAAGQAQKEVTHNEALALIDAAIAPSVVAVAATVPPADPQRGQCWIVGSGAGGAWTGQVGSLAVWTEGGWRFVMLPTGATLFETGTGLRWVRGTSAWQAPASIANPVGGAVIDSEVRAALSALLSALTARGIIMVP